jgi:hypothetical protein
MTKQQHSTSADCRGEAETSARINQAVALALDCGGYDGAHHKMWTLDQVIRVLTGPDYARRVAAFEAATGCQWDTGIAP